MVVNEELTAEEWKRRFEKEKEKVAKLRGALGKYELELQRWRGGTTLKIYTVGNVVLTSVLGSLADLLKL